ncbi:MAG TPA: OPT family oligopeptide transporter [Caulobacteraceae bacterium]|nr:OPT family oligopeptide transporter [Caulobacteraceae bacterium]
MTQAVLEGPEADALAAAHPRGSELTWQSIFAAVIVACIMGAAYPYMVLKLGFGPNVSIVSAFFGFLILSVIARKDYDRWQNNIVQTCGTSAAMTAFMCGVLAAFDMLRANHVVRFTINPTPLQTFFWLSSASLLGVLLAVPMRRHFIVDEKLPFPDGMAAGETLMVLDPPRGLPRHDPAVVTARRAALIMGLALLASGLVMILRSDARIFDILPEGWDPGTLALGTAAAGFTLATMGVGFGYSLLNLGTGFLISYRINIWMLVGTIVGWVVAPLLLTRYGIVHNQPKRLEVLLWVMWPGLGMIVGGGLTAMAVRWRLLVQAFRTLNTSAIAGDEFPLRWVIGGVVVLASAFCIFQRLFFGLPIWLSAIAVVLAIPLMLVGLRALGETNWGPIGSLSNLAQTLFAGLSPGNPAAIILGGAATGTIAVTSEGLIQDYRAGHMIGSTPRSMTIAQLIGAPIGAAVLAVAYPALVKTYGLIGEHARLAAPGARVTAGFTQILATGGAGLPPSALWALLGAFVLGVILAVLEQRPAWRRWVPSPLGFPIGMLLPFSTVAGMFLGGSIGTVWQRRHPASAAKYLVALASGLIAGEAMVAIIVPVLVALGLGKG